MPSPLACIQTPQHGKLRCRPRRAAPISSSGTENAERISQSTWSWRPELLRRGTPGALLSNGGQWGGAKAGEDVEHRRQADDLRVPLEIPERARLAHPLKIDPTPSPRSTHLPPTLPVRRVAAARTSSLAPRSGRLLGGYVALASTRAGWPVAWITTRTFGFVCLGTGSACSSSVPNVAKRRPCHQQGRAARSTQPS